MTQAELMSRVSTAWSEPLELSGPAPRPVRLTRDGKIVNAIIVALKVIGVVVTLAAIVAVAAGIAIHSPDAPPVWMPLGPPLLFAAVIWAVGQPLRKDQALLALGQPTGAIVESMFSVKGGNRVQFVFLDAGGRVRAGSSFVSRGDTPEVGRVVTVLFDPQKPQRNTLYPSAVVEVVQAAS